MRYLRNLALPHPAMKAILEECLMAVTDAKARIERCEGTMSDLLPTWRLEPAVKALMAFKGFQIVASMITISELGALHRFNHPRQLMAYLGLVPSEDVLSVTKYFFEDFIRIAGKGYWGLSWSTHEPWAV